MSVVIDGSSGITTNSGTVVSTTDATLNGLTVGKGGGSVSTNTAVGASALNATNTGGLSTCVGYNAGSALTSGDSNNFFGAYAGRVTTTGLGNVGIGTSVLYDNVSGNYNIAVGQQALRYNTASYNTGVGYQSGYSNVQGSANTFLGYQAGYSFAAGSATSTYNTFLGYSAGYSITTGTGNTIIGTYSGNQGGLNITTASNNIVLSDGSGNPRLYYVGADVAWKSKEIYNFTSANSANMYIGSGYDIGRITSALKYKQDVRDLESIDITKFRAVRYKSKCANDDQTKDYFGFIADEVAEAGIEELVVRNAENEVESFAYDRMTVVLLKSLQELKALVDAQATEIAELKAKVNV